MIFGVRKQAGHFVRLGGAKSTFNNVCTIISGKFPHGLSVVVGVVVIIAVCKLGEISLPKAVYSYF